MAAYGNPYPQFGGYQQRQQNFQQEPQAQYIQPTQQLQIAQLPGYICRPVTSREEAVAVQVDFLGMGTIMPDFSHGLIYFKRFNQNTGAAEFFTFQRIENAAPTYPADTTPPAVSLAAFEELAARVDKLEGVKKSVAK